MEAFNFGKSFLQSNIGLKLFAEFKPELRISERLYMVINFYKTFYVVVLTFLSGCSWRYLTDFSSTSSSYSERQGNLLVLPRCFGKVFGIWFV